MLTYNNRRGKRYIQKHGQNKFDDLPLDLQIGTSRNNLKIFQLKEVSFSLEANIEKKIYKMKTVSFGRGQRK